MAALVFYARELGTPNWKYDLPLGVWFSCRRETRLVAVSMLLSRHWPWRFDSRASDHDGRNDAGARVRRGVYSDLWNRRHGGDLGAQKRRDLLLVVHVSPRHVRYWN